MALSCFDGLIANICMHKWNFTDGRSIAEPGSTLELRSCTVLVFLPSPLTIPSHHNAKGSVGGTSLFNTNEQKIKQVGKASSVPFVVVTPRGVRRDTDE